MCCPFMADVFIALGRTSQASSIWVWTTEWAQGLEAQQSLGLGLRVVYLGDREVWFCGRCP